MSDMTIDIVGYLRRNLKHPKQLDFTDDVIWFVGDMEQELALTKKQLKIALDALKEIADAPIGYCMFAEEALDKIKALEQKEVK